MEALTPKQRMLNAYRGVFNDRPAVAPELWYYYPAKLLGVDMIEFELEVPFHHALKQTFEHFDCEGWGITFGSAPNPQTETMVKDEWLNENELKKTTIVKTPHGNLQSSQVYSKDEPSWCTESFIKNPKQDLAAWEAIAFGAVEADFEVMPLNKAISEVGESYLLEMWLAGPFFDFYASSRNGGFETAIFDFMDPEFEPTLQRLQKQYIEMLLRRIDVLCCKTQFESYCIGCAWSCNSLIGPDLWRKWDKPVIKAVADALHKHGKLLHIHFHGKCMETVADFAEIDIDCVCPFERPPGGDVVGLEGLRQVEKLLAGRITMNGNVHTVETLIRGTEADVRREVREILEAFKANPRVIVGTGDQVGRETPEENLFAMINEVKKTERKSSNEQT
jgi:Uroporphyrinogen decarboxylase (URO-D)